MAAALAPVDKVVAVSLVSKLLGQYYPRDDMAAQGTVMIAVSAVRDVAEWALRRACQQWADGQAPNQVLGKPPDSAQLRRVADLILQPHRAELAKLERVLSAPKVQEAATEEGRARALAHWENVVKPELQQRSRDLSRTPQPESPAQTLARISGMSVEQVEAELSKI